MMRNLLKKIWYFGARPEIENPKPFSRVENGFLVRGKLPKSWFPNGFYGGLDVTSGLNNERIAGQGITLHPQPGLLGRLQRKIPFSTSVGFIAVSGTFLLRSSGRLVLEISGSTNKSVFLPVILDGLDDPSVDQSELNKQHVTATKKMAKIKRDLEKYHSKLNKLYKARYAAYEEAIKDVEPSSTEPRDGDFLDDIFRTIQYSEDSELVALKNKYPDAVKWAGPIARGLVGRMNGFQFVVYSNDHDKHFHVLHREKGINARFSYPEIQLINYKNRRGIISSKDRDNIQNYFQDPAHFAKLETEFSKKVA
jgi:hypothetical protein